MERHAIIDYLAEEAIEDRLVVFLGAGCSKWAGLPSWDELLVDLRDKVGLRTRETNLLRLALRLEKTMKPLPFREAIVGRLRVPPDKSSELHNAVANLGIHWYITTNYDQLPENALRLGRISPKVIINPRNVPALKRREKSVIKLHGDIDDPRTIVITEEDYRKYCHDNRQFVDWLNGIFTSETILFLGVSFRDARLVKADQYITNYFGKYRRPPVVVLKRPKKPHQQDHTQNGSIQDDYASALEDFQFSVETFRGNNFHVLVINDYSELPFFIIDIGKELKARRLKQLEQEAINSGLVRKFKSEALIEQDIDAKIKKLGNLFWIRAKKEATELEEFVKSNVEPIPVSARSKACIAISDFISNSRQATDLQKAWEYLEKATEITDQIEDKRDLHKRLNRLRAKLLWYEERHDKALESIANGLSEPKTRSLWLLILADTGRYPEADDFIESHDIHMRWAEAALSVLCRSGQIQKARDFYAKAIAHHKETLVAGGKNGIAANAENLGDVLKATLAFGILNSVAQEAGKDKRAGLFPEQLDDAGIASLHEILELLEDVFDKQRTSDLSRSRNKFLAALVELQASYLLGLHERAHEVASHLLKSGVVTQEVGSYITSQSERFTKEDLRELANYLEANYGKTLWALNQRAGIHAFEFGEADTAWDLLLKTKELLKDDYDKAIWLDLIISVGRQLNRLDDVERFVKEVLPEEGVHRRLFSGRLAEIRGDDEGAEKYFLSVSDDLEAPKVEVFQALTALAEIREKNGDLVKAREYLETALEIHIVPLLVRGQLLRILIKLDDTGAILERCQQLEQLGRADEATLKWQGQAAYALERLEESERVFKVLVSKHGLTAEGAAQQALSIGRQGKHRLREALDILHPYIQNHEQFDAECLEIAVDLSSMAGDDNAAWRLLGERFDHIQNNMRLLAKAMVLGFRTNNEHQAHLAMMRLIQLQEDKSARGDNVEPILWKISIPEVIEISKRRQEALERATRLYLVGDLPRWIATDVFGMTLHEDWAVRTQPLTALPEDPMQRARYVTYSTPGMRLSNTSGRPNWVTFEIPPDIREIVVDAHALITLYRLGLLSLMERRFDRIYYPRVFHDIWAEERMKYRHHQKSEADASREIVQRLDRNEIAEIETPTNDRAGPNEDRLLKDVRLSESKGCPLVNAFASPEHFPGNIKVPIIRLFQLASWLFSAGKLSRSKHDRVSCVQEAPLMTTGAVEEQLDRATGLVISLGTLKEICKLDILTELLTSGKKIMFEATSGRIARWAIKEVEFLEETGREQERLEEFLNNSHVFVGQPVTKHVDTDKPGHELGYLGLMSTINLAIEKHLHICTDDRALQRFADPKWFGATFGTDALLGDLYTKNILNIEECAKYFLQMCEWRYRFLIPDIQILVHLAREYRASPPGKGLQDLADYWDDCQQDAGLPLAVPPGQMIVPLGVKIWMAWHDAWVNMLIQLWEQEPQACSEWLEKLTDAVLVELLPSPPAALIESVASNIMELEERSVFTHIFIAMAHSKHPEKLKPLASQTARLLLGNEDKVWQEAKEFLGWLSERAPQATDWMKICTLNVMKGLTGGTLDVIPRDLVPELERLGITPTEHAQSVQSEALKKAITEARERLTE